MAASKAPKPDFAPAWLKIPEEDSLKPSGPKSAEHPSKSGRKNKKDDYNNYNRYAAASEYMYAPLQRQKSFDNYYDERRNSPQKFRHHSVDDDYYNASYNYGYYNGYYTEAYGNHYRSQPSLYKEGETKYTHPNATRNQPGPGCTGQVIGDYPQYYDPYLYEYYGDPYYPSYMHRSGANGGCKRDSVDRQGKPDKQNEPQRKRSNSIEEDFPSLNGDADPNDKSAKPVTGNSVWDKAPKTILGSKQSSFEEKQSNLEPSVQADAGDDRVRPNASTFKMFKVSTKSGKDKTRSSGTPSPKGPVTLLKNCSKDLSKDGPKQHTTPIEISGLLTHPSNKLHDRKSEFLRTLRQEISSDASDLNGRRGRERAENRFEEYGFGAREEELKMKRLTNGVNDLNTGSPNAGILSGSLEAEQRLLREMGWDENNEDDDYVITDDDVREFEKLSNQIKEKNGFQKSLPSNWSPQHLSVCAETSGMRGAPLFSTSDSDSDLK